VSDLLKLIIVDGFAIVGAIAATRWLWRLLNAAEARCLNALAQQAKGHGGGDG
jgi:hypothetical protein